MKTPKAAIRRAGVVLVLAMAFNAQAYLDHWNSGTGGKPSRNGLTWERGPTNTTLLWQGGLYSSDGFPIVMEGNIVAMSRVTFSTPVDPTNVQKEAIIVARNLTTGEILWTNSLPVDFPETDWFCSVTAIRDARVYATRSGNGNSSYLYALDAQTGKLSWRSQDTVNFSLVESPSFAPNGDLIVGGFFTLTRINATNGARVWSTARTTPASGGGEPAIFGNRIYAWEQSGAGPQVSTFDLATGARLYSSPGLNGMVQQIGLFVSSDGTVYAPRAQNNVITDYLIALQDTGAALVEKWRIPLGYVPFASFGVGPDGTVYSYSRDYRVIRIRPQDGSVINSSEVLPSDFYQPRMAIDSTGILFVSNGGFSQGAIFSFNPDLTLRWTQSIPGINTGGPAIGKNGILVVSGNGTEVRAYRGNSDGLPGPPIQLSRDGNNLIITYSGILESADHLPGAWVEVPGAASPWTVPLTEAQKFYRSNQD